MNLYKSQAAQRLFFELEEGDKWYTFFDEQFDELWKNSREWKK
jgi:hypothetical protein